MAEKKEYFMGMTRKECDEIERKNTERKKEIHELSLQIYNICKEHNLNWNELNYSLQNNLKELIHQNYHM